MNVKQRNVKISVQSTIGSLKYQTGSIQVRDLWHTYFHFWLAIPLPNSIEAREIRLSMSTMAMIFSFATFLIETYEVYLLIPIRK